jgi:precorrin-6A/cobalt-precorrin-6A reductase
VILVLAGTAEGRSLVEDLFGAGFKLLVSTSTFYGAWLVERTGINCTRFGPLSLDSMVAVVKENNITAIIDATHPFAAAVSKIAHEVANSCQIPLIRYSRSSTEIPMNSLIEIAASWEEAVEKAKTLGPNIFLTIGTRNLHLFVTGLTGLNVRLIPRVLPLHESIIRCQELGIPPKDIVAMQGPFSKELNLALMKFYGITGMISKESGQEGGAEEKIAACLESSVPLILVKRPSYSGECLKSNSDVIQRLRELQIS